MPREDPVRGQYRPKTRAFYRWVHVVCSWTGHEGSSTNATLGQSKPHEWIDPTRTSGLTPQTSSGTWRHVWIYFTRIRIDSTNIVRPTVRELYRPRQEWSAGWIDSTNIRGPRGSSTSATLGGSPSHTSGLDPARTSGSTPQTSRDLEARVDRLHTHKWVDSTNIIDPRGSG